MLRALAVTAALASLPATAHAESWYEGEHGTSRVVHVSLTTVGFIAYPLLNGVEDDLAPETCRWCEPNALDTAGRDLRWSDAALGSRLSDIMSFGVAPALSLGLVSLGTLDGERSWARAIDDFTPIVEAMVITQWVTRGLKLAIGRQRPYAHFDGPTPGDDDANMAFPSGHSSRAFALATSAAMVARERGYKSEPYIWAAGLTVATASAYLRIAGDKHYVTDVLSGAVLGAAIGLTVPLLMRRSAPVDVTATRSAFSVALAW